MCASVRLGLGCSLEAAAENYYEPSVCCVSPQDKATIFPIKLSGPVLVKSLPLLAETDLTCFLPALKVDIMLLL